MTSEEKLTRLIMVGLEAAGCMIPVEVDGNFIAVRDLVLELDGDITCHCVSDGVPRPVFAMPPGSIEAAASAVVVRIVSGIVTRAVEQASVKIGA